MYYCDNLYIILKKYHIGVNSNYKMEKEEKPKIIHYIQQALRDLPA